MDKEKYISEPGCLTERTLRDYLEGELPVEDIRKVERHLSHCVLCQEAVDGLKEVEDLDEVPGRIAHIKKQVHPYLRQKHLQSSKLKLSRQILIYILVIIAILLFAFYAIDFMLKKEKGHSSVPAPNEQVEPENPK